MPDDSQQARHIYRLFGLTIASAIELPELPPVDADGPADVVISEWTGEKAGPGTIVIPDIAAFHVSGGSRIRIAAAQGAAPRNVRLYLLGSAMGLLLHQRGLLPLHAGAVEIDGRAIAFMGASGTGKSTLAAWFHDRGHGFLADDVLVVRFGDDGWPVALPGMPRLRLWREALELSGREPSGFERSYAGDDDWEKYDVPLAVDAAGEPPIAALYRIDFGETAAIHRLQGLATAEAVFANTYRGHYVTEEGDPAAHWRSCLALVERVPVFEFRRPHGFDRIEDGLEQLLAHARSVIAAS